MFNPRPRYLGRVASKITYDITSNKKRRKIDKLLSSYGDRVNFSVFEVECKKSEFEPLQEKLKSYMDKTDSVRIYLIDKTTLKTALELNPKREHPFEREVMYV